MLLLPCGRPPLGERPSHPHRRWAGLVAPNAAGSTERSPLKARAARPGLQRCRWLWRPPVSEDTSTLAQPRGGVGDGSRCCDGRLRLRCGCRPLRLVLRLVPLPSCAARSAPRQRTQAAGCGSVIIIFQCDNYIFFSALKPQGAAGAGAGDNYISNLKPFILIIGGCGRCRLVACCLRDVCACSSVL